MNDKQRIGYAVASYRKVLKADITADEARVENAVKVSVLEGEEFKEYARLTQAIDEAVDKAESLADESQWSVSTKKNQIRATINRAGLQRA